MIEGTPNPELMRSLGRLVRGLSALFWGLPFTLLICAQTQVYGRIKELGIILPPVANGLLLYGLMQMSSFQPQERVWSNALDRAKLLNVINIGLSPFLYFWFRLPSEKFFAMAVGLLFLSGILFLFNLNLVLNRLAAMLPDETLRQDTRVFTGVNRYILFFVVALVAMYNIMGQFQVLPDNLLLLLNFLNQARQLLMILLILMPIAMTMTLIWKIKEVVLEGVFNREN